jgi:hypothetical protein
MDLRFKVECGLVEVPLTCSDYMAQRPSGTIIHNRTQLISKQVTAVAVRRAATFTSLRHIPYAVASNSIIRAAAIDSCSPS